MDKALKVFFCYSRKDEEIRDEIDTCLSLLKRQGIIESWHDRRIPAGKNWQEEIHEELLSSQVILLLVSLNFLASDYCYDIELKKALELHSDRKALVVPIIIKPCDWEYNTPFHALQCIPTDGKPLTTWENRDEALLNITTELRRAITGFSRNTSKTYIFETMRNQIINAGKTPYILVDATIVGVNVPNQFIENNKIVLDLNPVAITQYGLKNEIISFQAQFGGVTQQIIIPINAVDAVYGKEDGEGMVFN